MKKQMIWGLAALMLLLGTAAVFLFIDKDTTPEPKLTLGQQTKDLLKKGAPLPQQPPQDVNDQGPLPPDDGREYVWHGNHWDLVEAPSEPIVQRDQLPPLTSQELDKLWVSENGRPLSTFTVDGWPVPEGTLPSEIDLEGANALRKKLFTGLTYSEVSSLTFLTIVQIM